MCEFIELSDPDNISKGLQNLTLDDHCTRQLAISTNQHNVSSKFTLFKKFLRHKIECVMSVRAEEGQSSSTGTEV
jgi:hypothetical protein